MEPAVLRNELREAQRQLTAAPIDHYKVLRALLGTAAQEASL